MGPGPAHRAVGGPSRSEAILGPGGRFRPGILFRLPAGLHLPERTQAGPDGGTEDKPVGTTWICVVYKEKTHTVKFRFGGSRERIIDQASYSAMQLLRRLILDMI